MLWGGIQMCCWFHDELWGLQPSPWEIRKDAERSAYARFVKEVQDGGESAANGSSYKPRGGAGRV
jgi:hypothetical protein